MTLNVLMIKHASAENAKILACLRNVESMLFVCQRTIGPTAIAPKTTRVTHMCNASLMNAWWMMTVRIIWLAAMRNAETPVTVL